MDIFIVVSVHGYQEDEVIEKIYASEAKAERFIVTQNKKREALGLKKGRWAILDKEVIL